MKLSAEVAWKALAAIDDPEIPGVSIVDLGIVRRVELRGDAVRVGLTPTYSGCPALKFIEGEVVSSLRRCGFKEIEIDTVLSPPWTSDWLSETARRKLQAAGIAPPGSALVPSPQEIVRCPSCGSAETELRSEFGSTSCRSLQYCKTCMQPFERFKPI